MKLQEFYEEHVDEDGLIDEEYLNLFFHLQDKEFAENVVTAGFILLALLGMYFIFKLIF